MEDFLLRSAESSGTGDAGMRSLREALACDPSHAQAWYRFGFLLRRQAHLRDAAARALELSIALKPSAAGPAHAEMTLLALVAYTHELQASAPPPCEPCRLRASPARARPHELQPPLRVVSVAR